MEWCSCWYRYLSRDPEVLWLNLLRVNEQLFHHGHIGPTNKAKIKYAGSQALVWIDLQLR